MGLGSCEYVSLQEARQKAWEAQRQRLNGVDPLLAKREACAARKPLTATKTFAEAAQAYLKAHEAGWRGDGSRKQWQESLDNYVFPSLGRKPVNAISTAGVLATLSPIWQRIPETARRVRNRVELIIDFATAHEWRTGDNPARWRGLMENLLPDQRKANGKKHLPAMAWKELPAFMAKLRANPENGARALEMLILCASRPGEILKACWSEFDGDTWVIPPERMKGHREHRVPLCARAQELLATLPRVGEYVFVGRGDHPGQHALGRVLRRMGWAEITAHGFRSSFRDWATECTQYPNHVVEMALAHQIPSAVERAYRRGDLLDQRRRMMEDWSNYLMGDAK